MNILSVFNGKNAGVSFSNGDEVLYSCAEERLVREKLYRGFPSLAIQSTLERFKLQANDIDFVACGAWSRPEYDVILDIAKSINPSIPEVASTRVYNSLNIDSLYGQEFLIKAARAFPSAQIKLYDHHLSHAASAFYSSGYTDSYVITADGRGDLQCLVIWHASRSDGIKRLVSFSELKSLGAFYGQITYLLGFKPDRHEGKITGLAAFGKTTDLIDEFSSMLFFKDGNLFTSDKFIPFMRPDSAAYMTSLTAKYSKEDVAYAAQEILERIIVQVVNYYVPKEEKLATAGGIFANVKLNQRIRERCELESMFVFPEMGDGGISYGSLQLAMVENDIEPKPLSNMYLGPSFSWEKIDLSAYDVQYFSTLNHVSEAAVGYILDDKILGIFTGRMEYGPRALGSRSIVFQAVDSEVNKTINQRLNRTEFMPFAPVTLADSASDMYINYSGDDKNLDYMTTCYECTERMQALSPAVVHVDNTARPQIIRANHENQLYYLVLKTYFDKTGIPSLVNTSFNNHEEPIVCSPLDALDSLDKNNVDFIVSDNLIISKKTSYSQKSPKIK